jgi:hypothetical protein
MQDYEVVKTDQGYVVVVAGKYYSLPASARLMPPEDLRIIFEGLKNTTPIAGRIERADVTANFIHQKSDAPTPGVDQKNEQNRQNETNRQGAAPAPGTDQANAQPWQGRRRWRPTESKPGSSLAEPAPGSSPANEVGVLGQRAPVV